jgi:hypothetical protein
MQAFKAFLLMHPDIADELDLLNDSRHEILIPEKVSFDAKMDLRHSLPTNLSERNWDDLMIAALEDDIVATEKNQLLKLIHNNPSLKREWDLFQLTKLNPKDTAVDFSKAGLYRKKETRIIYLERAFLFRAAAVLLVFGISLQWWIKEQNNFEPVPHQLAITAMPNEPSQFEVQENEVVSNTSSKVELEKRIPEVNEVKELYFVANNMLELSSISVRGVSALAVNSENSFPEILTDTPPLKSIELPGIALASNSSLPSENNGRYFDLNSPIKSLKTWVKQQGKSRLDLPEGKELAIPGSVEYASAGAALLEKITGKTFALEPEFDNEGNMKNLSLRAGNYRLMVK